jgi:hypothetical protein
MMWGGEAQSSQSARLSFQSSELAPPLPLTRKRMLSPFWFQGGGHTRLLVRGRGKLMRTKGHTLWYSSIIPLRGRGKEEAYHLYTSLEKHKDDFFHVHLSGAVYSSSTLPTQALQAGKKNK